MVSRARGAVPGSMPFQTEATLQYGARRCVCWAITRLLTYLSAPQMNRTGDQATREAAAKPTSAGTPAQRASGGSHARAYGLNATATARAAAPRTGRFEASARD